MVIGLKYKNTLLIIVFLLISCQNYWCQKYTTLKSESPNGSELITLFEDNSFEYAVYPSCPNCYSKIGKGTFTKTRKKLHLRFDNMFNVDSVVKQKKVHKDTCLITFIDYQTGEPIPFCNTAFTFMKKGALANSGSDGRIKIPIPFVGKRATIESSYIGYHKFKGEINLAKGYHYFVKLKSKNDNEYVKGDSLIFYRKINLFGKIRMKQIKQSYKKYSKTSERIRYFQTHSKK